LNFPLDLGVLRLFLVESVRRSLVAVKLAATLPGYLARTAAKEAKRFWRTRSVKTPLNFVSSTGITGK
jgi:hypothetical protein